MMVVGGGTSDKKICLGWLLSGRLANMVIIGGAVESNDVVWVMGFCLFCEQDERRSKRGKR